MPYGVNIPNEYADIFFLYIPPSPTLSPVCLLNVDYLVLFDWYFNSQASYLFQHIVANGYQYMDLEAIYAFAIINLLVISWECCNRNWKMMERGKKHREIHQLYNKIYYYKHF